MKVRAKEDFSSDGKNVDCGEIIDLPTGRAQYLISFGVVEEVKEEKEEKKILLGTKEELLAQCGKEGLTIPAQLSKEEIIFCLERFYYYSSLESDQLLAIYEGIEWPTKISHETENGLKTIVKILVFFDFKYETYKTKTIPELEEIMKNRQMVFRPHLKKHETILRILHYEELKKLKREDLVYLLKEKGIKSSKEEKEDLLIRKYMEQG